MKERNYLEEGAIKTTCIHQKLVTRVIEPYNRAADPTFGCDVRAVCNVDLSDNNFCSLAHCMEAKKNLTVAIGLVGRFGKEVMVEGLQEALQGSQEGFQATFGLVGG